MNLEKTPTKSVPQKKGRKRKAESRSVKVLQIFHRSCVTSYGNFQSFKAGYISTENIFYIPKKKGLNKSLVSYLVDDQGSHLHSGEHQSTRVCSPWVCVVCVVCVVRCEPKVSRGFPLSGTF